MIATFIIVGFFGGVLGGMGMGGGTLLIPLLTTFAFFTQKEAAFCNLVVFIPLAILSLIIHNKNHLVVTKGILPVIGISLVFVVLFSLLSVSLESKMLQVLFGVFLVGISVHQFVLALKQKKEA